MKPGRALAGLTFMLALLSLPISPTPRVDVWYQRQRAWAGTHLASFRPPAWLLVTLTLTPSILALPAIARRRRG